MHLYCMHNERISIIVDFPWRNHCTVGELKQLGGHCEAIMYFDALAAAGRVSHCSFEAISDYGWVFPQMMLDLHHS